MSSQTHHTPTTLPRTAGIKSRFYSLADDGVQCSVEDLALEFYASEVSVMCAHRRWWCVGAHPWCAGRSWDIGRRAWRPQTSLRRRCWCVESSRSECMPHSMGTAGPAHAGRGAVDGRARRGRHLGHPFWTPHVGRHLHGRRARCVQVCVFVVCSKQHSSCVCVCV